MGAFRNTWITSFHIRMNDDLTLSEIVKEAKESIPELKRVKVTELLKCLTIAGKTQGGKFLIIGYNSNPKLD